MMRTSLCDQLGIVHPSFSVGMGGSAGPELVAAVSNAGACGVLGTGARPASQLRERIRHLRTLTDKPFGVNILLPLLQEGQIETCLDEKIPILVLFWGDPTPYVAEAHRRGIKVLIQVGSVEEARAAGQRGWTRSSLRGLRPAGM